MFSTAFATTKFFVVFNPIIGASPLRGTVGFFARMERSNFVEERGTGPRRVDFRKSSCAADDCPFALPNERASLFKQFPVEPTRRCVPWRPNVVPTGAVYGSWRERYIAGFSTRTSGFSIQPYRLSDIS